ncbi:MAG TPA: exodeoxyribonuclease III [Novosphingobium sp.]|nr:exodeoxyribonuclease III [Novosphingobium sp.]
MSTQETGTPDPSNLSIATWNINSVRLRMPLVARYIAEHAPDVLCLQEIKTVAELFPAQAFADLGYVHQAVHGQKGYHGVATVSRVPFKEFSRHDWQDNGEARHVGVELTGPRGQGLVVENVYIPAGGDIPDRALNPKFGQKLDFLERMTRWAEKIDRPAVIVGDFNIAPLESDVWSHKALRNVVSHTDIEIETLARFQAAHNWADVGRQMIPAPERYYSWWSYRAKDWRENDRGRRLDHVWASQDVAAQARAHRILEDARNWEKCSDHVPIITEFAL